MSDGVGSRFRLQGSLLLFYLCKVEKDLNVAQALLFSPAVPPTCLPPSVPGPAGSRSALSVP